MGLLSKVKKGLKKAQAKARDTVETLHTAALADVASMTGQGGLLTNPGQWAENVKGGIVTDVTTGARVMKQFGSGQWGELGKEAAGDLSRVFGASTKQQQKISEWGEKAGSAYEKADELAGAAQGVYDAGNTGDYRGALKSAEGFGGDIGDSAKQAGGLMDKGQSLYNRGMGAMSDAEGALAEVEAGVAFDALGTNIPGAGKIAQTVKSVKGARGSVSQVLAESAGKAGLKLPTAAKLASGFKAKTLTGIGPRLSIGATRGTASVDDLASTGNAKPARSAGAPKGIIESILAALGL